jgi:predicted RNA-binding protein with PIN domain
VADLYLFDGSNLLHAGGFEDRGRLVDLLSGHVAMLGARGVVVFDGAGDEDVVGSLEVRFATPADPVIERLAAESRDEGRVVVVSSDRTLRATAGHRVVHRSSASFLREAAADPPATAPKGPPRSTVEDALDPGVRARLERWRRRGV